MSQDKDIKTSVDEDTYDRFYLLSRQYGFKTRTECNRWLINRELAWFEHQLQIKPTPNGVPVRD